MTRRENTVTRRTPRRQTRPRILVVSGSARTEEQYFQGLRSSVASRSVDLVLVKHPKSPRDVVQYTVNYVRDAAKDFDAVWCVFDVDQFEIASALAEAGEHGINVAVSNPCFELWLLLHRGDCRSHCAGCNDVVRRLKKQVPAYDKARLRFSDYAEGVADAVKRARDLDPTGTEHRRNPSTSVWRLVETIMEQQA